MAVSQERHSCVSNRKVIKVLHQNRFCPLLGFKQMNGLVPTTGKLRIPIHGPRTIQVPHSLLPQSLPIAEVPDSLALPVDSYFKARAPSHRSDNTSGPREKRSTRVFCIPHQEPITPGTLCVPLSRQEARRMGGSGEATGKGSLQLRTWLLGH